MNKLHVITFSDSPLAENNALVQSCSDEKLPLHILQPDIEWTCNTIKLRLLWNLLVSNTIDDSCVLLICDAFDVVVVGREEEILKKFEDIDADIVFSAEANFYLRNPKLNYFYWKHYPRQSTPYNFLNSGNFMGTVANIRQMMSTIFSRYNIDPEDIDQLRAIYSDQYLLSRFYVDYYYAPHMFDFTIKLDYRQSLFACTAGRMFATEEIPNNWVEVFFFFRYQRFIFKYVGDLGHQIRCIDITLSDGKLTNKHTGTNPAVLHIPGSRKTFTQALALLSGEKKFEAGKLSVIASHMLTKIARLTAQMTRFIIEFINGGEHSPQSIFRSRLHSNPDFIEAGEKIASRLEQKSPVAFAHFSEDEFGFITHHLNKKSNDLCKSGSREKNASMLGDALFRSLTFLSSHYLRGIPCGTCYPELRRIAEEYTGNGDTVVPAMTLHHNLALMPRILMALEGRDLWFMADSRQDLSFFKNKGLMVKSEQVVRLPYCYSLEKFENLKSMRFADESVVIMTCGVMAKVLMPVWIENNPHTSFLDFGASLDDHIQSKYRFRSFPVKLSMTKNLYGSKSFLFGPKKTCPECYPLGD